jgi:hypothetical protein
MFAKNPENFVNGIHITNIERLLLVAVDCDAPYQGTLELVFGKDSWLDIHCGWCQPNEGVEGRTATFIERGLGLVNVNFPVLFWPCCSVRSLKR